MLPASETATAHRGDREWIGAAAATLLTGGIALAGALLAGARGTPDPLIVAGLSCLLFCGIITYLLVALTGRFLVRRGWPRAVRGARWAGRVAALLNVAFWIMALAIERKRHAPALAFAQPPAFHVRL